MSLQFRQAAADWAGGVRLYPLWITLAWREILQRYRRSTVGPFWITFSMAVMVGALGLVYGTLFKMDLTEYLPFLAIGLVLWNLFTSLINDGCSTFVSASNYLKQVALPKSVFVFQMTMRNLIVFGHNVAIIVAVMLWFGVVPHPSAWWAVPVGLAATLVSGAAMAAALGVISARFRDLPQVILSLTQVLFFVTPVMYRGDMLAGHEWIMRVNPFYYYLETIRRPLLGAPAAPELAAGALALTAACVVGALLVFARYRRRLNYWL